MLEHSTHGTGCSWSLGEGGEVLEVSVAFKIHTLALGLLKAKTWWQLVRVLGQVSISRLFLIQLLHLFKKLFLF